MIRATDHSTGLLFDRWSHIGPKRRKLLDTSWPGVFRNYLLHKLPVERIAARLSKYTGRPSKELYTVLGAVILQQPLDLSDEELTRAVALNLEFHYALDIIDNSDESTYISERTLRNYRKIIEEEGLAPIIFGTLTDEMLKAFKVDASLQRMDSTHVQSNMRKLGRVRLFVAAIQKFLRAVRRSQRKQFTTSLSSEFVDRYLAKDANGCFSRVKPSESSRTLETLSRDLHWLIETFFTEERIRKMPEYQDLERVLREQCTVTEAGEETQVTVKPPKAVSPDSLQNPSDPDASYNAHKGQGYEVQLMETYQTGERDPKIPNLATYVDVNPAHAHDANELLPAIDAVKERNCGPRELVCDTHYGSDENVLAAAGKGVAVIAPVAGNTPAEGITLAQFSPDPTTGYVTRCPEGHAPLTMRQTEKERLIATFSLETCQACPRQQECPVRMGKKAASLNYTPTALRSAVRRTGEHTREFKEKYRHRAGIEGTNSHLKSDQRMGRLKVRGLEAVRLAVTFKVLGMNIMRCARALAARYCDFLVHFSGSIPSKLPLTQLMEKLCSPIQPFSQKIMLVSPKMHFAI